MDMLHISALSIMTHIGIHAWEQRILQQVVLDIRIPMDLTTCKNELENTIDYDKLARNVTALVEATPFALIETLAETVALHIKDEFQVSELTLTVSKPQAIKNAGNVSVTITR